MKKLDENEIILNSQLGAIFREDLTSAALKSLKKNNFLVKPAHLIHEEKNSNQLSVADCLLNKESIKNQKITNNRVYLISRGCVYEHNKSCFNM